MTQSVSLLTQASRGLRSVSVQPCNWLRNTFVTVGDNFVKVWGTQGELSCWWR